MAKKSVTLDMDAHEARVIAKRCTRLGKTTDEVLRDRSIRDIVREEVFASVDRLISAGSIPEAIVSEIENQA